MKKLCFLLCLLMTLASLVACGNGDGEDTDKPAISTSTPAKKEGLVLSVEDEITIGVGDTKQITAINAKTGMQTSAVLWESDNKEVADVDFEGKVTGKADGSATITAKSIDGSLSASCTVKVTSVLSDIVLSAANIELNKGETAVLTVSFIPESYTSAELTWVSSDPSVVSVLDGVLTAHADGSATIAVSTEGITKVCSVTVVTPVTSLTLSETELTLVKGNTSKLTASVLPANASDPSINWTSSNPDVVRVADDGTLTALTGGTATITAKTSNNITATCVVTVNVPVTGIAIMPTEVTLDPGDTQMLTIAISPIDANEQSVIWESSNPTVATVVNGEIKALSAGTATIKVTTVQGYYTATCAVTVTNSITGLSFEQPEGNLLIGQTITLLPIKAPVDAEDAPYTWTTSDPLVASVDANGLVTALAAGKADITVTTDKGVSATYTLNVIDPATINVPIESIKVDNIAVEEGETFSLNITVTPSNYTEQYIVTSGNTNRVVVNSDGTLTAVRSGTIYVTVSTLDGAISTRCLVTVNKMSDDKKAEKQQEYDAALATLDQAHDRVLADIASKYDVDIALYKNAVDNASLTDEAEYNKQKNALQKAIDSASAADKAILQQELQALEDEWSAYQLAVRTWDSLVKQKDAEVTAENDSYNQKVAQLKAQYPYLF